MIEHTARKILDLPRNELTEERVQRILSTQIAKLKLEIKKQTLLFLIECHNQQMTISEAVVMINNLEDGQQFLSEPNEN